MRHLQRPRAALFRLPCRAGSDDMAQGVGPRIGHVTVKEGARIRRAANSDAVDHHQERTAHHDIRA